MEEALVIRKTEDGVWVWCPYCRGTHKHGDVVTGSPRMSDCEKGGREYRVGGEVPVREIALALKRRELDLRRKRVRRSAPGGDEGVPGSSSESS